MKVFKSYPITYSLLVKSYFCGHEHQVQRYGVTHNRC